MILVQQIPVHKIIQLLRRLYHLVRFHMAGMMVRKSQELSQERADELETVHFIAEYSQECLQDIKHFPVVEQTKKAVVLKVLTVRKQIRQPRFL